MDKSNLAKSTTSGEQTARPRSLHRLPLQYLWQVAKTLLAYPWSWGRKLFRRINAFLHHLILAPVGLLQGLFAVLRSPFQAPGKRTHPGLKASMGLAGAWLGRFTTKTLDIMGTAEILDFINQTLKVNTRPLTPEEIGEARKVFADAIPYWQVRVDEASFIAHIGKWIKGAKTMGVVVGHTINFTRKIQPRPGNADMAWLIHELTHVAQYERVGLQYMGEALHAQFSNGYRYGGPAGLRGKKLAQFNREQQGDIARDYYQEVLYGNWPIETYQPLIDEMKQGKF